MTKRITALIMTLIMLLGAGFLTCSITSAASPNGNIYGNGTNGIYIDIMAYPYTKFAAIPNWGQYAYGEQGCSWFACARYAELTGYSGTIWSGWSWWHNQYATYGLQRSSQIRAKAFACYDNHIAVVERVDGNIVTLSEGGARAYPGNSYCAITTKTVAEVEAYDSLRGNFLGYVYLGVAAGNEPLTNPEISSDKEIYTLSDTVNLTWKASSPNSVLSHYWIYILSPSGREITSHRINGATSYSFVPDETGQYAIRVSATPVGSVAGEGSLTAEKFITVAPAAGKPTLSVKPGNAASKTVFSWEKTDNTTGYMLEVKKTDGTFKKSYALLVNDNSFSNVFSAGDYTATLCAYAANSAATPSDEVRFTITPTADDLGWMYSDTLPTGGNYEIQYKYTYEKKSAADLGSGWVKNGSGETVYENSGEPYWSQIELPTSSERVLLNYIYYHYCGGSNGNNANFTSTSAYPHYDWLSKDGVYEVSSNTDYDDARYRYYHLKWADGSDAYCSSGVSCDGSHGAHGARTCYWYRSSQYQDKVAVTYYNYINEGKWTSARETDYEKVTYRYRLKGEGMLGDVNGDGKITVVDATLVQKRSAGIITLDESALLRADVNSKGGVNVVDATMIQKFVAGLIQRF